MAASPSPAAAPGAVKDGISGDCTPVLGDEASVVGAGISTLDIEGLIVSGPDGAADASEVLVGTSLKVVCSMVDGATVTIGWPAVFSKVIAGAVEMTTVGSSGTTSE